MSNLHVALNGTRSRTDHSAIPTTPEQLATEASASVAAGASAIHVHIRDGHGSETLAADDVSRSLEAIRSSCPDTAVGISTGAWIIPDLRERLAVIRTWDLLPDVASVNLHEAGAAFVIRELLDKGIGVEAGIWNAPAAITLVESGLAPHCLRVLLEPAEASCSPRVNLRQIETVLSGLTEPRLLHGLGRFAWEFLEIAAARNYDARIGFEDSLTLPDGALASGNADMVLAARRILRRMEERRSSVSIF